MNQAELSKLLDEKLAFLKPEPAVIEPGMTFGALYAIYLSHHVAVRCKNPANFKYWASRHLPAWQDAIVADIKRAEVQLWVDELGTKSQSAATRAVHTMAAIINWGRRREYVTLPNNCNPCSLVDKFRMKSRDRFLSPSELDKFRIALKLEPVTVRDIFFMLLATGQRRGNVLSMAWDEIDLELALWRIPAQKFKNGDPHTVPLNDYALDILVRRFHTKDSPWVFPGRTKGCHVRCMKKAWTRILNRAGLKELRIHDLRRSVGSYMAINGANPYVIGKALGHKDPRSTAVYARLDLGAVRSMQETIKPVLFGGEPPPEFDPAKVILMSSKKKQLMSADQAVTESKILAVLRQNNATKKAFYTKIGSKRYVDAIEMDRILKDMESRGLIISWKDDLQIRVIWYAIANGAEARIAT